MANRILDSLHVSLGMLRTFHGSRTTKSSAATVCHALYHYLVNVLSADLHAQVLIFVHSDFKLRESLRIGHGHMVSLLSPSKCHRIHRRCDRSLWVSTLYLVPATQLLIALDISQASVVVNVRTAASTPDTGIYSKLLLVYR